MYCEQCRQNLTPASILNCISFHILLPIPKHVLYDCSSLLHVCPQRCHKFRLGQVHLSQGEILDRRISKISLGLSFQHDEKMHFVNLCCTFKLCLKPEGWNIVTHVDNFTEEKRYLVWPLLISIVC